jgi:hypothetical protein
MATSNSFFFFFFSPSYMAGDFGTFISKRILYTLGNRFYISRNFGEKKRKKKNTVLRSNGFPDNAALVTEGPARSLKGTAEQGRVHTCQGPSLQQVPTHQCGRAGTVLPLFNNRRSYGTRNKEIQSTAVSEYSKTLRNQRTAGSGYLKKNQNQRTSGFQERTGNFLCGF